MILKSVEHLNIFQLDDSIWIAEQKIDVPNYDFHFEQFFPCYHPLYPKKGITVVGRFGVTENYSDLFFELNSLGIALIHNPSQYLLASELTNWYSLLKDITPKSIWYDEIPTIEQIENDFDYPIFIKGSRQTNKHKASLSIAKSKSELKNIIFEYKRNPILHWQKFVVREYVNLRIVKSTETEKIPASFEFRTFWWKNNLVGEGIYWKDFAKYNWTKSERIKALSVAENAALKLNLPFIVIDIAQMENGKWLIIESNDGQESGYAGISPISLWQNIVEIEKKNL